MHPQLVSVARERLDSASSAVSPSARSAAALAGAGLAVRHADLRGVAAGSADGVVLLDDELGAEPDHAEQLVARAAQALAVGGLVLVGVRSAVHAEAVGAPVAGTYRATELERMLGHRGFAVELLCAPGAARALAGRPPAYDPELDRQPGLLDAGPWVVAVGRRHADGEARSAAFFASLPRKVVAAAVLCRDPRGRLLCVYDSFKRHWTIPGGVVDADEDPSAGAARETWEEAGVRARVGRLLGLFAESWPDRLVLVYEGTVDGAPGPLAPVHTHEIAAAEWAPLDEALARLNPRTAAQVRRCLEHPGTSWPHPPRPPRPKR